MASSIKKIRIGSTDYPIFAPGVLQQSYSGNYNLPLLMSYQANTNSTADIYEKTFRNNAIYANPGTGMIASKSHKIGEHVLLQYNANTEALEFVFE